MKTMTIDQTEDLVLVLRLRANTLARQDLGTQVFLVKAILRKGETLTEKPGNYTLEVGELALKT
jgi:hypothetical protein